MGFLDKVKTATEQAVARGKEEIEEQKTKRELNQAYGDLGEAAFGLVESGAITSDSLNAGVERIRTLKAKLAQLEEQAASSPAADDDSAAGPSAS
jgi:hypothetical protein